MTEEVPQREFAFEAAVYLAVLSLTSFLWQRPWVLLACLALTSGLMLRRWHRRSDVVIYGTASCWDR